MRFAVLAIKGNPIMVISLANSKMGQVMRAGEEFTADEQVEPGRGVAARDINPFSKFSLVFPFNSDAVGRVFRPNANIDGNKLWMDVSETDQANSSHANAVDELGMERGRQDFQQH